MPLQTSYLLFLRSIEKVGTQLRNPCIGCPGSLKLALMAPTSRVTPVRSLNAQRSSFILASHWHPCHRVHDLSFTSLPSSRRSQRPVGAGARVFSRLNVMESICEISAGAAMQRLDLGRVMPLVSKIVEKSARPAVRAAKYHHSRYSMRRTCKQSQMLQRQR